MKVLFLDFDGVLNSHQWMQANQALLARHCKEVDKAAVARVQRICDATDAKVVISSTWRLLYPLAELRDILKKHGLIADVIGKTPNLESARGKEIEKWLRDNGPVEGFVILDDDSDMVHLLNKLVQTSFSDGLLDIHVDRAIAVLQEKV